MCERAKEEELLYKSRKRRIFSSSSKELQSHLFIYKYKEQAKDSKQQDYDLSLTIEHRVMRMILNFILYYS